jgi:hypothetical protein
MPSFTSDGYLFRAGIEAEEGSHEGIILWHRNLSPNETAEYNQEVGGLGGKAARRVQAKWLLKKIQKWQMPDGSDCPELEEGVFLDGNGKGEYVHSILLSRIIGIVIWGDAPDYGEKCDVEELAKN